MVNFKDNSEPDMTAENLNKMQTDLQQEIATAKSGSETQINTAKSDLTSKINDSIANSFATRLDLKLGDLETKIVTIERGKPYLYINCHISGRCMLLITTGLSDTEVKTDVIFKSNDLAVPQISRDGNNLTLKYLSVHRGYLFGLNKLTSI